jgi:hypothetical protein
MTMHVQIAHALTSSLQKNVCPISELLQIKRFDPIHLMSTVVQHYNNQTTPTEAGEGTFYCTNDQWLD